MKKKIILALLAVLLLAAPSCALTAAKGDPQLKEGKFLKLAQNYPIPDLNSGELKLAEPSPELLASWWTTFSDETLTRLIEYALKNSRDLNTARSRVVQARAGLTSSRANLLPWLDATGTYQRGMKSEAANGKAEEGGSGGMTGNVFSLGVDASWEIDIFGARRAEVKASKAAVQAQYAQLYNTWVSLSAEIALEYITLRTAQLSLDVAEENYKLREATYKLQESRWKAGLADQLTLQQAKYTMEQVEALIPPLKTTVEECKNALAVLVGKIPGELEQELRERKKIPVASGGVLYGIPANMLRQRPDIQAAERQVAAAFAKRQAAKANLWPRFFLAGSIGTEAIDGDSLFKAGARSFGFGPSVTLPIFRWGALQSNVTVQTEAEKQALYAYESTVLKAIAEVRDALVDSVHGIDRGNSLKDGMDAAQAAVQIAEDKYNAGLVNFDTVINAQEAYLSLSEQYAVNKGRISAATIQLFKALGGGWQPIDAELTKK